MSVRTSQQTGINLRVVWITGPFPADASIFLEASEALETLSVFGAERPDVGDTFEPKRPAGVPSRVFQPRGWLSRGQLWWWYPGLMKELTKQRPDVVHVVSEPWGLNAVQAAVWARRHPDASLVLHGCDRIWWHGSKIERLVRRRVASFTLGVARGYVAETPVAIERALESGLSPEAITATAHTNPRDETLFEPSPSPQERADARRHLGLPLTGVGVGFMGRMVPEKGVLVFLDAVERLVGEDRATPTWYAVAGSGPLSAAVERRCASLGITYLDTLSYPTQVLSWYRAIDVAVVPSYTTPSWDDQSPRVIIEAMLAGRLIVGTDCGAIPEMLGGHGIVVPENDVSALAAGIRSAFDQLSASVTGRSQPLVYEPKRVRERAAGEYSASGVANRLSTVWRQATAKKRSAAVLEVPSRRSILMTAGAFTVDGRTNLGDEAQAQEGLRRLRRAFPDHDITIVANSAHDANDEVLAPDPTIIRFILGTGATTGHMQWVPARITALSRAVRLVLRARSRASGRATRDRNDDIAAVLDYLDGHDGLYMSGAGAWNDLYMSSVGALWLTIIATMHELGKPVVMSGQQVGPLTRRWAQVLAVQAFRRASVVGVRDHESLDRVSRICGPGANAVLTGDDAWDIPPALDDAVREVLAGTNADGGFIAVQVRADESTMWSAAHLPSFARQLDDAATELRLPILLVSIFHTPDGSGDLALARQLDALLTATSAVVDTRLSPAQTKALLGKARVAVGVSNHFCVFAASAGTPVVGVYRSDYLGQKLRGLAAMSPGRVTAIDLRDRDSRGSRDSQGSITGAILKSRHLPKTTPQSAPDRSPEAAIEVLASLIQRQV